MASCIIGQSLKPFTSKGFSLVRKLACVQVGSDCRYNSSLSNTHPALVLDASSKYVQAYGMHTLLGLYADQAAVRAS